MKKAGFTLIELIVVITILAILGTIAFIGFKGYTSDARDSKVTTDIANLHNVLSILKSSEGFVPMPDNPLTVKAGTVDITFEGEVGDNVRNTLKASSDTKNPFGENYKYAVKKGQKDYTLVAELENDTASLVTTVSAGSEATTKYFKGDNVLTLFDEVNNFKAGDILSVSATDKAYIGEEEMSNLGSKIQMRTCYDIKKAGFGTSNGNYTINPDGSDISVYCDMNTDGGGWTLISNTKTPEQNGVNGGITASSFSDGNYQIVTENWGVDEVLFECKSPTTGTLKKIALYNVGECLPKTFGAPYETGVLCKVGRDGVRGYRKVLNWQMDENLPDSSPLGRPNRFGRYSETYPNPHAGHSVLGSRGNVDFCNNEINTGGHKFYTR